MRIVLLGAPGCGKGTQSEMLAKEHGFVAISAGNLLRANRDRVIDGTRIGDILDAGLLLPDQVTISLVNEAVGEARNNDIVFDGFPRTVVQAEALANELGGDVDKVINFKIDDNVLVKRIIGRFQCSKCGKIYNKFFILPLVGGVCDVCGSEIFEYRADDNESSLRKRLEEYHKKTHPLIDFYSKSGILCNVSADVCLENVSKSIVEILKDKKEKR